MSHFSLVAVSLRRRLLLLAALAPLVGCSASPVAENAPTTASSPWYNRDGSIRWPPNEGFAGKPTDVTIDVGAQLSRYGYPGGTFVSPLDVPIPELSLAPGTTQKPHYVYQVLKPLPALEGTAAAWFGEPGGGVQYDLVKSIEHWLDAGYLEVVTVAGELEQDVESLEAAIAADMVSLSGGLPNEAHVLEQWVDGAWRTYYSERGKRTELKTFATEAEARADLQRRVTQ